ncbi:MAG TPA: adenine phosphoribosyltransferase [Rudaea sp.]|nr:adenine phosphoribosyltransferase [Rudaea sp.]
MTFDIASHIRDVPDFPKPGIVFKDITPLLRDADALRATIAALAAPFRAARIDAVCGVESRGFIFGAALACELGAGFVPIRKPRKLPAKTIGMDYVLEYGTDRVEIHADALAPGARVLLVDDVVATGGTLLASRALLTLLNVELVAAAVVIELAFLEARSRWPRDVPLHALVAY